MNITSIHKKHKIIEDLESGGYSTTTTEQIDSFSNLDVIEIDVNSEQSFSTNEEYVALDLNSHLQKKKDIASNDKNVKIKSFCSDPYVPLAVPQVVTKEILDNDLNIRIKKQNEIDSYMTSYYYKIISCIFKRRDSATLWLNDAVAEYIYNRLNLDDLESFLLQKYQKIFENIKTIDNVKLFHTDEELLQKAYNEYTLENKKLNDKPCILLRHPQTKTRVEQFESNVNIQRFLFQFCVCHINENSKIECYCQYKQHGCIQPHHYRIKDDQLKKQKKAERQRRYKQKLKLKAKKSICKK